MSCIHPRNSLYWKSGRGGRTHRAVRCRLVPSVGSRRNEPTFVSRHICRGRGGGWPPSANPMREGQEGETQTNLCASNLHMKFCSFVSKMFHFSDFDKDKCSLSSPPTHILSKSTRQTTLAIEGSLLNATARSHLHRNHQPTSILKDTQRTDQPYPPHETPPVEPQSRRFVE